ncbi:MULTISPECIES: YoaK family protein [unclassified Sphingomonas]|uniref:YoaK family protein n=1 Tax=unclassified Sphingomonas TaxID=196159 RepID=UPI0004523C47|nr:MULTISPECIES: DUF1275 family protein [unclassified Sphingomonas]EZP52598.1 hypothetical protein BW41_02359 [Sphingomonas sp. RIT328]
MTRYAKRYWILAAALAALAGYVDAIGLLKMGGLFVSFMSGNSTRFAVGLAVDHAAAATAAPLIAAFVGGVMVGTILTRIAGDRRKPAALIGVTLLLAAAAASEGRASTALTTALLAAAMGMANTAFQHDGEVSIGVTYMTGTLVKFGQRLAAALIGGPRWAWLPYLVLWSGLVGGAWLGATVYPDYGRGAIEAAAAVAALLAGYAAWLGPAGRDAARRGRG